MTSNLKNLIALGTKLQKVAYNSGHPNSGASIDVMQYVMSEFNGNKRFSSNRKVQFLLSEILGWNASNDALKYAKPLAQNTRLAVRREILQRKAR